MHRTIDPAILYFGTPVALISTLNPDGTPNLAPISSAWWLGWSCIHGLGVMGQTAANLVRTAECVINLRSCAQVSQVHRLALTTGRDPVPGKKPAWGYRHEGDEFGAAALTPLNSVTVAPPRVLDCPVQMEGHGRPHIDPLRWQPLMMGGEVHPSRLAESSFRNAVAR